MNLPTEVVPGNETNNALYRAIYFGIMEKVTITLDSFPLSQFPSWNVNYNFLLTAIKGKHSEIAKLLIKKGFKLERLPSELSQESTSVLHSAVRLGDLELLKMLLDTNSGLLTKIENGYSLLHIAVLEDQSSIARLLLERGADIECKSSKGETPLHLASARGYTWAVEDLVRSGADIESKDDLGKTSLFHAVSSGQKTVVKLLLQIGANSNQRDKNELSPLLDATRKGYLEIVKDLVAFGADIDVKNNNGLTPLHMACMLHRIQIFKTLLHAGADVNAEDCEGMVPSDTIVKKLSCEYFIFENSNLAYIMGRHLLILCAGGFYLNKKNLLFLDKFYGLYCCKISVEANGEVSTSSSDSINTTNKRCKEEIGLMKSTKSDCGFTAYDIFRKLKNSQSIVTKSEILFLDSIGFKDLFPLYEGIITNLLIKAKLRNELLLPSQDLFSSVINLGSKEIPVLPEEMITLIVSYLTNDEMKHWIHCAEEIGRNYEL